MLPSERDSRASPRLSFRLSPLEAASGTAGWRASIRRSEQPPLPAHRAGAAAHLQSSRRYRVLANGSLGRALPGRREERNSPHCIPNGGADLLELSRCDPIRRCHPRSAASDDVLEREVALEVRACDSAAGIELYAAEWSRQQLQIGDAAERIDRPQLEEREPRFERRFDLGCGGDTRVNWHVVLETVVDDGSIESRRYDEVRSGFSRLRGLADVEHGIGSGEHL